MYSLQYTYGYTITMRSNEFGTNVAVQRSYRVRNHTLMCIILCNESTLRLNYNIVLLLDRTYCSCVNFNVPGINLILAYSISTRTKNKFLDRYKMKKYKFKSDESFIIQ